MRPTSLAVIGLGAIGGSLAWQARLAGIPSVVGYAADRGDTVQALKSAALHDIADSAVRAVRGADLVVLATPPNAVLALLAEIAPHLSPDAIVTDVASIKAPIVARARALGLATRFAGSHPFTGTHVTGWDGARADRFHGAIVYVCPTGVEGNQAAREVMNFWETVLGAVPVLLDATLHDTQLAWTSHLPQAVATALAETLAGEASLRGASLAGGARDTTRLAASGPEMWVDIFLANREPLLLALDRMGERLGEIRQLVAEGDREGLTARLAAAAEFRRGLEGTGQGGPGDR